MKRAKNWFTLSCEKLSEVFLDVSDIPNSQGFFRSIFGLNVDPGVPGRWWLYARVNTGSGRGRRS